MKILGLVVVWLILGGCVSNRVYKRDVDELGRQIVRLSNEVDEKERAIAVYEGIYRETRAIYERVEADARVGKEK